MKRFFRYERRHEKLAAPNVLFSRLAASGAVSAVVILLSLLGGTLGYRWTEGMEWLDALLNASMILGGMGPVEPALKTPAGKIFASIYALYCGVVILLNVGVLMAPLAHRILHQFHLEADKAGNDVT